jgi:hypothetical protein
MEDKIKILLLSANPKSTTPLSLGEEIREISLALKKANYRDRFQFIPKSAVRVDDLLEELLSESPQIVHFSGHGGGDEGLVLEDDLGKANSVDTESLARLFQSCADTVQCVVLNACYSDVQADAIHVHIDHVIGMSQAIGDKAAIEFAKGFYTALGAGRSIESAFEIGCTVLDLKSIPESFKPVIRYRTRGLKLISTEPNQSKPIISYSPSRPGSGEADPISQNDRSETINAQKAQGFINHATASVTQHFGNQTTVNTGGGDYAGRDIYKSDRPARPGNRISIQTVFDQIVQLIQQAETQGDDDLADDLRSVEADLKVAIKADEEAKSERRQAKLENAKRSLQELVKQHPDLQGVLSLLQQVT